MNKPRVNFDLIETVYAGARLRCYITDGEHYQYFTERVELNNREYCREDWQLIFYRLLFKKLRELLLVIENWEDKAENLIERNGYIANYEYVPDVCYPKPTNYQIVASRP